MRMACFLLGAAGGALSALALNLAKLPLVDWVAQAVAAERRPPELFTEIYQVVHERYVSLPDDSKLIEGAIKGLMWGLDPHSEYLDAQSFRTVQEEARGVFGGLGLQLTVENSLIKVVASIPDSHAAKAGLRPGDLIVRIDGVSVRDLTVNQSIERMRGPVASKVRLTVEPIAKLPGDNWDCGSSRLAMIARRVFCKPALDHGAVDAMHWQVLDAVRLCGVSSLSNWAGAAVRRTDRGQTINRKS